MNRIYGVRFALSFKSEKNWYEINAMGGWVMLLWSLPILAWGLYGRLLPHGRILHFHRWNSCVILACVLLGTLHSYLLARKIDQRNHPAG